MHPLNILTWHVHGNYLYYLSHCRHNFYVPVKPDRPEGYGGRSGTLPWPANLIEIPAEEVKRKSFDCILFQSHRNYLVDQYDILTPEQRQLPKVFLEHDPPRETPTDTKHPVNDPDILLVHVTEFNRLMWDNNRTPTTVIEHGVIVPKDVRYTGELNCGLVIVNGLPTRGRRLGLDIVESLRSKIPLEIIGMQSERIGGRGEIPWPSLAEFQSRYRYFFNPIRYTSLGLAVCEAMMVGMPVVGLATTELAATIENGYNGYIDTNIEHLRDKMKELLENPELARRLGKGAEETAKKRFSLARFVRDWERTLTRVAGSAAFEQRVATDIAVGGAA